MSYILVAYIAGLIVKLTEDSDSAEGLNTEVIIKAVAYPIPVSVALVKLGTVAAIKIKDIVLKIKSLFGGNNVPPTV
jgi:hypothetical protein